MTKIARPDGFVLRTVARMGGDSLASSATPLPERTQAPRSEQQRRSPPLVRVDATSTYPAHTHAMNTGCSLMRW